MLLVILVGIRGIFIQTTAHRISMGRTVYIYLHENRKPIGNQQNSWIGKYTPRKFNMEPEKESLEKEIPFGNHHLYHFQVPC